MPLRTLLRDPLAHFIGIGLVALLLSPADTGTPPSVLLSGDDVSAITTRFELTHERAPTASEEKDLIQRAIHEEVLVQEARALELDLGDPIIRGRLVQKMAHLARGATPPEDPDESTLKEWYKAHTDRYTRPALIDFQHVYFQRDRPDGDAKKQRDQALEELRIGGSPEGRGDPFTHGPRFRGRTLPDVRTLLGGPATEKVAVQEKNQWFSVDSPYGSHAVRITSRVPGKSVPLDDVRDRVLRDWRVAQTRRQESQAIQTLLSRYSIRVKGAEWSP